MKKLDRLLYEAARVAEKAGAKHLYLWLNNSEVEIDLSGERRKIKAKNPLEMVEAVEKLIKNEKPGHVVVSYGFDDLLDLFPEMENVFPEPIPTGNISSGKWANYLETYSLRHLLLHLHVHMMGAPCISHIEKGIVFTEEQLQAAVKDEVVLWAFLAYIERQEIYYRDNCQDDPMYPYIARKGRVQIA